MSHSPGMPPPVGEPPPRPRVWRILDAALDRTVVGGFSKIGYAVRRRLPGWPTDPSPDALAGRHVLVTGATSGLGLQTARRCAELGATVHLVVRNAGRAQDVVAGLPGTARIWECDVSDLASVERFAAAYLAGGDPVDALVHNAGALPPRRTVSAQGHEMTMALHVLGPVLMTERLRPAMAERRTRVVFVTSGGMYTQALPVADPEYLEGDYAGAVAYARSKRTQVELLTVLAGRWAPDAVGVWATHPGWADTPGVTESLPRFGKVAGPILRDAVDGVDTTVWLLATHPAPPSGGLWHDRAERPTSMTPWTRASASDRDRMWQWVAQALDLS